MSQTNNHSMEENYGLPKTYLTPERVRAQSEYDNKIKAIDKSDDRTVVLAFITMIIVVISLFLYAYLNGRTIDYSTPLAIRQQVAIKSASAVIFAIIAVIACDMINLAFDTRRSINRKKEKLGDKPNRFNYLMTPFERIENFRLEEVAPDNHRTTVGTRTFNITSKIEENGKTHVEVVLTGEKPHEGLTSYGTYPKEADFKLCVERTIRHMIPTESIS